MTLYVLNLKKIHLLIMKCIFILIVLFLVSCQDKGGGVVNNTNETPAPVIQVPSVPSIPEFYGPFGGAINNDEVIPPPSVYQAALTTYDLEQLIYNANEGDTIYLSRDINITYTLYLEKSVKFESQNGKRIKIMGSNLITLIQTNIDNISFKNIDFYLSNVQEFYTSPTNSTGDPTLNGLTLDSNTFFLSGKSSLKVMINSLNMKNNSIFGVSSVSRLIPLVSIQGNNLNILANNIFDNTLNYQTGLLLRRSNSGYMADNRIVSYSKGVYGALTLSDVSNYQIINNFLYDKNSTRVKNDGFTLDPNVDGSIGIAVELSKFISDLGNGNKVYATHNKITDIGNNLPEESSNLTLNTFQILNNILPSQLFNNASSLDFTPICLIGTNPIISTSVIVSGKTYVLQSAESLYYTGSIKPACL